MSFFEKFKIDCKISIIFDLCRTDVCSLIAAFCTKVSQLQIKNR